MVTAKRFRALCLSLDDTSEAPHFDRAAFRTPKRIYATLAADDKTANLRLAPPHQEMLCAAKPEAFWPVKGAWGAQGWTTVTLAAVDEASLLAALRDAHQLALAVNPGRRASAAGSSGRARRSRGGGKRA